MKKILLSCLCLMLLSTEIIFSQILEKKQATPQRPSIATSTFTTYPGSFELETGMSFTERYLENQFTIKYGAGLNFEAFLMFSPYVRDTDLKSDGIGDVYVGGRYRFWMNFYEDKSIALQLWGKLPAQKANRSWASGELDFQGMLIYTAVYPKYTIDVNLGLTMYTRPHGRGNPIDEPFATLCWTGNITNKFSVLAEVHGYIEKEPKRNVGIALAGFSYAITPGFVVDTGVSWSINEAPYDWMILPGFTINF